MAEQFTAQTDSFGASVSTDNDSVTIDSPPAPDEGTIEWNGQRYEKDTVMEVVSQFDNWQNAQKAITQRHQANADDRREVESLRQDYEARLAQLESRPTEAQPFGQEDDEVNVLRREFTQGINEIKGLVKPWVDRQASAEAELQKESAFDQALASYQMKPLANLPEMRSYMDSKGFGPEHADVAYMALYGKSLGEMIGATRRDERSVPGILGSTGRGASPPWTATHEVPQQAKPMSQTSVEEIIQNGLNDPEI